MNNKQLKNAVMKKVILSVALVMGLGFRTSKHKTQHSV